LFYTTNRKLRSAACVLIARHRTPNTPTSLVRAYRSCKVVVVCPQCVRTVVTHPGAPSPRTNSECYAGVLSKDCRTRLSGDCAKQTKSEDEKTEHFIKRRFNPLIKCLGNVVQWVKLNLRKK
jgi:hypothetical protein